MELGLKDNLGEVTFLLSNKKKKRLRKEHSPIPLYSDFNNFIEEALLCIKEKDLHEETCAKNENLLNLVSNIKNIDDTSQYFRFPADKKGNSTNVIQDNNILLNLLELYYETDSFLSFAIPALQKYGYISTSNEKYI